MQSDLHKRTLYKLCDLCGRSGLLPESYCLVEDIQLLGNRPISLGGSSDVFRGTYAERLVAVKVLRVSVDDQDNVKKVQL
jgi:hypothetical protein